MRAAVALLGERLTSQIRLDDVARRAGVSVQTVLRVYGSWAALFALAFEEALPVIAEELHRARPGDVAGSVSAWFDHYERVGDMVLQGLAEEADPTVGPLLATGRDKHRTNVQRQFAPWPADVPGQDRTGLLDALVCVCDVYTWKLLRRDMGRSRSEAEATMRRMVTALLDDDGDVPQRVLDLVWRG